MGQKGMTRFMFIMFGLMAASLIIVGMWNSVPVIKSSVNYVLNPSLGALINWDITWGTLLVFFIIALITTLIQKYATDQETLRELRKEQKEMQKEMKKYKEDPKKMMELQKELWPSTMKMMEVSMKSSLFTIIPFILLIRWFMDYFTAMGSPDIIFGIGWFGSYFISLILFSSILRKVFKVA
ncbi:MAG: EMC3/TMCO1 family protein [Nanoarchaeota archaeon]|nr:TMCO1/EMC3 family protein [Nanoarchaeota archaeon]